MAEIVVAGVGMTNFGRFTDRSVRNLAAEAARDALADAGVDAREVGLLAFGNAMSGLITGQECVRGQVAFRHTDLARTPIVNVENACASGSTALHVAAMAVRSGQCDVALAVGAERLTHPDKAVSFKAMESAIDVEEALANPGAAAPGRSVFMDIYAAMTRDYMAASGATAADFADVAVKSHRAASRNPKAQYRNEVTRDEVLASRLVVDPLTLLMCSPIGDGAAAVVVMSREAARRRGARDDVVLRASVLQTGAGDAEIETGATRAARRAYEVAGIGPDEVDVVELHDASAPAELMLCEQLGLCGPGAAPDLLRSGATGLNGRVAVNSSGGLLSKGHPVGATGCAQVVELTQQLRGQSGARQREGARVALADNGGGFIGRDAAVTCVTILSR